MNYLAHGRGADDRPWLLAGTALPDWLRILDRRLRIQDEAAAAHTADADPRCADLARGVRRHLRDDAAFHTSAAFGEASREVAALLAPVRHEEPTARPRFIAHVVVEVLLDAELIRRDTGAVDRYYGALGELDSRDVERIAERLTPAAPRGLAHLVDAFVAARFVEEYRLDSGVARRLDQAFRRISQPEVGSLLLPLLPAARTVVAAHADALLVPPLDEGPLA